MSVTIRLATPADIPALEALIPGSARALGHGYYTPGQTEAAIRFVLGVDDEIVACGGWSRRRTLYGGDQRPMGAGAPLDPAVDAARIRAFFVAESHARQGIGARVLRTCAEAAFAAGFTRLELMSTLPGVPFYRKLGFQGVERVTDTLPDGTILEFVQMTRPVVLDAKVEDISHIVALSRKGG